MREGASYRILVEPDARNVDVRSFLSLQHPTLSWLHAMRENDYTASSNVATQQALRPDTDVPTATTLLSIAKLMCLQVPFEESADASTKHDAELKVQKINARLDLIDMQKNKIFYHSIANQAEVGRKWSEDQLLTMDETLECHFNRLRQLNTEPMLEWQTNILSLHSPMDKCKNAWTLIEHAWEELQHPKEIQNAKHLEFAEIQQLDALCSRQQNYYHQLVDDLCLNRSVDAVLCALQTVNSTSIANVEMTPNRTNACYSTVWKECLRADFQVLQAIANTNEVNAQQWQQLSEQSIFVRTIRKTADTPYRLNGMLLKESYHQISQEMPSIFGPQQLATLEKLYNFSSLAN